MARNPLWDYTTTINTIPTVLRIKAMERLIMASKNVDAGLFINRGQHLTCMSRRNTEEFIQRVPAKSKSYEGS